MFYFLNDHLGTPQKITDSSAQVVWAAAYLPFGEAQVKPEIITNNLRFPGQYFDAESGLHYNWNRYYDPDTGRYITADPIGLEGGINLYTYVNGNPMTWIDPLGLFRIIVCTDTNRLRLLGDDGTEIMNEEVVTGCKDSPTPKGTFYLGNWIHGKTNAQYGPIPWTTDKSNPYGPWFVGLYDNKNRYIEIGIHGTKGPMRDNVKPFLPYWLMKYRGWDKYAYCSHGCIRLSNNNIAKLHDLLPKPGKTEVIVKECGK